MYPSNHNSDGGNVDVNGNSNIDSVADKHDEQVSTLALSSSHQKRLKQKENGRGCKGKPLKSRLFQDHIIKD